MRLLVLLVVAGLLVSASQAQARAAEPPFHGSGEPPPQAVQFTPTQEGQEGSGQAVRAASTAGRCTESRSARRAWRSTQRAPADQRRSKG